MKNKVAYFLICFGAGFISCQTPINTSSINSNKSFMTTPIIKSETEWKQQLSPEQYNILRLKGTEQPGTGKYYAHSEKGIYTCAGCGSELFNSDQKFDSHCGWPSFDNNIAGGDRVKQIKDFSHGMIRTEIVCVNCGGHLGHIFNDGPTPSGQRYCVNSLSLNFKPTLLDSSKK